VPVNKPFSVVGMEIYGDKIYAYGGNGIIMNKNITYEPGLLVKNLDPDKILIYPNPARDYINIKTASSVYKVEIYNSIGNLLLVTKNMETINISHLSKGIYYVKISADNNIIITTQKIIKN